MKPGTAWPKNDASYELLGAIGKGATSVVHRARCRDNQAECAVKVFDLRNLPDSTEERIQKEVSTLALLDHPNVVRLYASFVARDTELWMVMQLFAHGSVLDVMRDKFPTGLVEDAIGAILLPVLSALHYLHSQSALHRDIKAGNIFVSSTGQVVLGDFGVATELIESGEAATGRRTFAGTPCWMAPEVMMQQTSYSVAADVWSFGITAIELAKGRAPHSDLNAMKVVMKIMSSPPPNLDDNDDKKRFSVKFRAMVRQCLNKEPEGRPTAAALLKDPFFKKVKDADYLQSLLAGLPPVWQRRKDGSAGALAAGMSARSACERGSLTLPQTRRRLLCQERPQSPQHLRHRHGQRRLVRSWRRWTQSRKLANEGHGQSAVGRVLAPIHFARASVAPRDVSASAPAHGSSGQEDVTTIVVRRIVLF